LEQLKNSALKSLLDGNVLLCHICLSLNLKHMHTCDNSS